MTIRFPTGSINATPSSFVQTKVDPNLVKIFSKIFPSSRLRSAIEIRTWLETNTSTLNQITELNLSYLELTALPSEICLFKNLKTLRLQRNLLTSLAGMPQDLPALEKLDLGYNHLSSLEGMPQDLPALEKLDMSGNQLSSLAGMPQDLPALEELILFGNRLTSLAGMPNLPALKVLLLLGNQLSSLAGMPNLPALKELNLEDNHLSSLEGMPNLPALKVLNLFSNRLPSLAGMPNLPALEALDMSGNQLSSLAGMPNLPALKGLYLRNNRLSSLEEMPQNLPALKELNLGCNQLQEINATLSLPFHCVVHAEGNRFSPEYVARYHALRNQQRAQDSRFGPNVEFSILDDHSDAPELPLQEQMSSWILEYADHFQNDWILEHCAYFSEDDFQSNMEFEELLFSNTEFKELLFLQEEQKTMLSKYLRRLREIKDYKNDDARKNSVLRVFRMLSLAGTNELFRGEMLALVSQGLETCGDRVLIQFNEIEILWQWYQVKTAEEARYFAIRSQRYFALKTHAIQESGRLQLGDQIETILAFHLQLREFLNLPITTQGMLYPVCSGVTEEMLHDAAIKIMEIRDEELLAQSDYWHAWIQKTHKDAVESINERYTLVMEAAQDYVNASDADKTKDLLLWDSKNWLSIQDLDTTVFNEILAALREVLLEMPADIPKNIVNITKAIEQARGKKIAQLA